MKQLLTMTISILAITLAGCNFYTDVDADWNASDESDQASECDELLVLLEAADDEARKAELAGEYSRCAGVDPGDESPGEGDCESEDGEDCRPDEPRDETCVDGRCDVDPEQIDCQQVEVWVSGHTADEALHFCRDLNLSDATCQTIIDQCLGENWAPGGDDGNTGSGSDICALAYDALEDVNISPDSLTSDEAYDLCIQGAAQTQDGEIDESMCRDIADRCFMGQGSDPGTSDPNDTCADLTQQAGDMGATEPTTREEANALHDECMQITGDQSICDELLICYGFMP